MKLEELKSQTILITGSAKRIGRDIAITLSKYQAKLILHYHQSEKEMEELLDVIKSYSPSSFSIRCDLTNPNDVKKMVSEIKKENISISIHNASIFPKYDIFSNFDFEKSIQIFTINLFSPLYLIKEIFKENQTNGLVINFIDASLNQIRVDHFAYRLSKYALEKATQMLAKELSPNVRVNGISPGAILPPVQIDENNKIITISDQEEIEKFYQHSIEKNLLKRKGDTSYIIQTLLYIIENDFLNGVIIPVDAGQYI